MPKPLKKAMGTRSKKRARTLDDGTLPRPVRNAVQKAKAETVQAPWLSEGMVPPVIPFAEQLSAHLRALGAKGGKVGGKRRLETMTEKQRKDVGWKAASARWAKKRRSAD